MRYLARDELYLHVKPYNFSFDDSSVPGALESNRVVEEQEVQLHQMHELSDIGLNTTGWIVLDEPLRVEPTALTDSDTVRKVYYPEIEDMIRRHLPQYDQVALIDHEVCCGCQRIFSPLQILTRSQVRKRSTSFPHRLNEITPHAQPLVMAHADYTHGQALRLFTEFIGENPSLAERSFDLLK
jgi:hypothetical protein